MAGAAADLGGPLEQEPRPAERAHLLGKRPRLPVTQGLPDLYRDDERCHQAGLPGPAPPLRS